MGKAAEEADAEAKSAALSAKEADLKAKIGQQSALKADGVPLKDLQDKAFCLAQGIDMQNREIYLAEAEFKEKMGMTKDEFKGKPAWKQNDLKKKANLY